MNNVPIIDRRKNPYLPPVSALILYGFTVVIAVVATYGWTRFTQTRIEERDRQSAYESCVSGNQILDTANDQSRVLREVVLNIIESRKQALAAAETQQDRRLAQDGITRYSGLISRIREYPKFDCKR